MQIEDQETGTSTPTELSAQDDSSSQTQEIQSPQVEQTTETTETAQPAAEVPINTVGAALDAFQKAKNEQPTSGLPKPGVQTSQEKTPYPQTARDYSGLSNEEVAYFKKMGDRAFAALKPQFLEYKKLKTDYAALKAQAEEAGKTSGFFHEEAYQLTPEYRSAVTNVLQLDREVQHWQSQIAKIRAGEEWIPIVLNEKGEPVMGAPQPASPQAEADVIGALTNAYSIKGRLVGELNQIKSNFVSQYQGFNKGLVAVENKIFEGADVEVLNKAMETKLPLFPKHMHSNPVVRSLAKALAVIDGMALLLQEQQGKQTTQNLKAKTVRNAGPTGQDTQPVITTGGKVGDILKEFDRERALGGGW